MKKIIYVLYDLCAGESRDAYTTYGDTRAAAVDLVRDAYAGTGLDELASELGFDSVVSLLDTIRSTNSLDDSLEIAIESCVLHA